MSSGSGIEFATSAIDQDLSAGVDQFFRAMTEGADGEEKLEAVKEKDGGWIQ